MNIPGYKIDLENVVNAIKKNNYKTILLQIPEGLKSYFSKIVAFIEQETKARVIISADPCYGACDIISFDSKNIGAELIIQIGHTQIPDINNAQIPTYFINAEADIDISQFFKKVISRLKGKKIGIVTTAQHLHIIDDAYKILKENNFTPVVSKGDNRIDAKGQILGCNFTSATSIVDKVDSFLFIGSGNFHPLGLILSTKKPVIVFDPYTSEIRDQEVLDLKEMILKQRYGAIARSKDAKVFGIIIGTKIGQQRGNLAFKIKEKLDLKAKKSFILTTNHLLPANLESFREIDCFVSTACPRIAIDDYMQYKTPILTPIELDILLGFKKWEDYQFDQILS